MSWEILVTEPLVKLQVCDLQLTLPRMFSIEFYDLFKQYLVEHALRTDSVGIRARLFLNLSNVLAIITVS